MIIASMRNKRLIIILQLRLDFKSSATGKTLEKQSALTKNCLHQGNIDLTVGAIIPCLHQEITD